MVSVADSIVVYEMYVLLIATACCCLLPFDRSKYHLTFWAYCISLSWMFMR